VAPRRGVGTLVGMEFSVETIPTAASYPLRHAVLRPHTGIEDVAWEGDDDPATATYGAVDRSNGAIVGVATVFPEPAPFDAAEAGAPLGTGSESTTWRLRGMATQEGLRGCGVGSMVLEAVVHHVAAQGGDLLWCNARVGAVAFYERAGFRTWGDVWVLPSVGPHVVMWRAIAPEPSR